MPLHRESRSLLYLQLTSHAGFYLPSHSSYRFPELMKFFTARRSSYHTNPRIIDDVIYTPYVYDPPNAAQRQVHFQPGPERVPTSTGDLLGVPELAPGGSTLDTQPSAPEEVGRDPKLKKPKRSKFEEVPTEAEIFLFEYGTVVIWGMTEAQEKRFLSSM